MSEITIEITDYCPNSCPYCSSNAGPNKTTFLSLETIQEKLNQTTWDLINISGGEPLAHPQFYKILQFCKTRVTPRTGIVCVYTNALEAILYNANIISGIRVEANLAILPNTNQVHILKMVKQGCESQRPEIHFSKNWSGECKCNNTVIKPNGTLAPSPCNKENKNVQTS